jgi:hypothetical protein
MEYDSVLSPRALREIYLMPFMLAQKYAQPWVIVTSCVEGSLTRTLVMTIAMSMVFVLPKMPISCVISFKKE